MSAAGGKRALLTAALLVAGIRLWMQLRGTTKTPFAEWAIGWGAFFFMMSVLSEVSPQAAGSLSLIVVVGDTLKNGSSLLTDVSGAITGAETGQTVFSQTPFATTQTPPAKSKPAATTSKA